jgi:hypothetical protein
MPQPHHETEQFVSELLGALNPPDSPPASAREWECIAVWAVVGYLVASDRMSPDDGVVPMLMEATGVLDRSPR